MIFEIVIYIFIFLLSSLEMDRCYEYILLFKIVDKLNKS